MSTTSFFTSSTFTAILYRALLIFITGAYLLGQVCASWGWFVFTSFWLSAFFLLIIGLWSCCGRGLAVIVGSILFAFSLANMAWQRISVPQFPADHLRRLSLPQEVLVEGWLFRE